MFRIDSQGTAVAPPATGAVGATVGYFTEGDPAQSIPATNVSADWLNSVQEELIAILTAAGITPDKPTRTQVRDSILALIEDRASLANFTIANNTAVAANITGLVFDSDDIKSAIIEYDLLRSDATPTEKSCVGKLIALWKPSAGWVLIGPDEHGDSDHGVVFSIDNSTGQVKYTSSNYGGGSYTGVLRLKVRRFKI